jgi:hypothetical protein
VLKHIWLYKSLFGPKTFRKLQFFFKKK